MENQCCRFCNQPTLNPYGFCSDACYTEFGQAMENMSDALAPHPESDFDMRNPDGTYINSEVVYGQQDADSEPVPDFTLQSYNDAF